MRLVVAMFFTEEAVANAGLVDVFALFAQKTGVQVRIGVEGAIVTFGVLFTRL